MGVTYNCYLRHLGLDFQVLSTHKWSQIFKNAHSWPDFHTELGTQGAEISRKSRQLFWCLNGRQVLLKLWPVIRSSVIGMFGAGLFFTLCGAQTVILIDLEQLLEGFGWKMPVTYYSENSTTLLLFLFAYPIDRELHIALDLAASYFYSVGQ